MLYDDRFETIVAPARPITPPLEPWQQTLLETAQVIRTRGWCKGALTNHKTGAVCIMGALVVVLTGHPYGSISHYDSALDALYRHHITPKWNDMRAGSASTVITAIEKVAFGEDPHL